MYVYVHAYTYCNVRAVLEFLEGKHERRVNNRAPQNAGIALEH